MPNQNLVSAVLTPEVQDGVIGKIDSINTDLNFLITLQPDEKNDYVKVGNTFLPFIDKAYAVVTAHPEIMPGVFDLDEYKNDYQLAKGLGEILRALRELTESVEDTYFAATNDSMKGSLDVYSSVQYNKNKIPGLDTEASAMKQFFRKSKSTGAEPAAE